MKRFFIFLSLLIPLSAASQDRLAMLVGTYTEGSNSIGAYLYSFDQETLEAQQLDVAGTGNPSFIIFAGKERAYSVSEYSDGRQAAVSYRLGADSIEVLNTQPMGYGKVNGDPCNLLMVNGMLITANYTGGSLSFFPIRADGRLGEMSAVHEEEGAHMHCIVRSPDGRYCYATDLGGDKILRIPDDPEEGEPFVTAYKGKKGLGPRHMTFSRDGRYAYLINELGDVLTVLRHEDGRFRKIQQLKAYDGGGKGSADIHLSPDGRFLYTSHRLKEDGIAVFRVDPRNGKVRKAGFQLTGRHPRNFAITPNGKYLLCACRDSDCIEIYAIDGTDGGLNDTGKRIMIGKPVCIQFRQDD